MSVTRAFKIKAVFLPYLNPIYDSAYTKYKSEYSRVRDPSPVLAISFSIRERQIVWDKEDTLYMSAFSDLQVYD